MKRERVRSLAWAAIVPALMMVVGCAGIARHMQSSSHKKIDEPPFFRDFAKNTPAQGSGFQLLPVKAGTDKMWFSPSLEPLQSAMNDYLAEQAWVPVRTGLSWVDKESPRVQFGDAELVLSSSNDDEKSSVEIPMVLHVTQPSRSWSEIWLENGEGQSDYTLLLWLELSAYKVNQKDWKGSKEIRLGTGYRMAVPWLTSLDDPVPVIHLTGVLLDREGKVVRAGAEGFFTKRTSFLRSVVGFSEWVTAADVAKVLTEHVREDLPGSPLAWQVALQNVVAHLLGRDDLVRK
ncbi:hypothetical protein JW992_16065 [candidate division KSB1 bacterium]|nr:hypothetical protein [candidate division KSB1 bacterium]